MTSSVHAGAATPLPDPGSPDLAAPRQYSLK